MARVEINQAGMNAYFVAESGPVMQNMVDRGYRVLSEAISKVPSDTGELVASLKVAVVPEGSQNVVRVGSDDDIALYVHEGTGPQHIEGNGGLGFSASPNPTYFPPFSQGRGVEGWSDRHGLIPYQVALHISIYGTPAFNFLRSSLPAAR